MLAPSTSATSAQVRGEGGASFDFVFILTVRTDAQRDVGVGERGGHHNKPGS